MSSPYVGELRLVGFNFAPVGWSMCQGQIVPISENDTLFNLIGTTYGGDGQTTFALPDLQGRTPIHQGTDPSTGSNYVIGEKAGVESVTLTSNQIPIHNHTLVGTSDAGTSNNAVGDVLGGGQPIYSSNQSPTAILLAGSLPNVGGSQPHDNLQPYLTLNWIISLFGIFPSQT